MARPFLVALNGDKRGTRGSEVTEWEGTGGEGRLSRGLIGEFSGGLNRAVFPASGTLKRLPSPR
jgi:hypothetical protein